MDRQEDGSFRFVISLEPGVYHYKFVLDDDEWVIDPSNSQKSYDGMGGDNNVLKVSA
jgi:1,4-alpha-glucan branching enzyme